MPGTTRPTRRRPAPAGGARDELRMNSTGARWRRRAGEAKKARCCCSLCVVVGALGSVVAAVQQHDAAATTTHQLTRPPRAWRLGLVLRSIGIHAGRLHCPSSSSPGPTAVAGGRMQRLALLPASVITSTSYAEGRPSSV